MKILALETATNVCDVALLDGRDLLARLTLNRPRAHAENLVVMVRDVLAYAGIDRTQLDAVAVSMGPGSYTGLRIGVSAAKGFATALGLRLVGVPSLDALALTAGRGLATNDVLLVGFNSRREEVYFAAYQPAGTSGLDTIVPATSAGTDIDLRPLLPEGASRVVVAGEAGGRLLRMMQDDPRICMLDARVVAPSAVAVGRLAAERLENDDSDDVASFEPFYLNQFVAKKPQRSVFERLPF